MMAGGDDDEEEMIRGRVREEEEETAPLAWESNVPEQSLDRVHRASTSALRGVRMQYEEGAGESGSHQTGNWPSFDWSLSPLYHHTDVLSSCVSQLL